MLLALLVFKHKLSLKVIIEMYSHVFRSLIFNNVKIGTT